MKLHVLLDEYRAKFEEMIEKAKLNPSNPDDSADLNLAVALYFCSYFHIKN